MAVMTITLLGSVMERPRNFVHINRESSPPSALSLLSSLALQTTTPTLSV